MSYKVLKPIPLGLERVLKAGEIVDAKNWRNLKQLISGRYLVEVFADVEPSRASTKVKKQAKSSDS